MVARGEDASAQASITLTATGKSPTMDWPLEDICKEWQVFKTLARCDYKLIVSLTDNNI